jgi:hypothetical protein
MVNQLLIDHTPILFRQGVKCDAIDLVLPAETLCRQGVKCDAVDLVLPVETPLYE